MVIEEEEDMLIYLRTVGFLAFIYLLGLLVNLNYFISNNIIAEFGNHFDGSLLVDKINKTVVNLSDAIKNISFVK